MRVTTPRVIVLQESVWNEELELTNRPQSSVEKQSNELPHTSVVSDKKDIEANKKDTSSNGSSLWSTWPRRFAFVITVGVICAAAVWLPLLLTNILGKTGTTGHQAILSFMDQHTTPTPTTTSTTTSASTTTATSTTSTSSTSTKTSTTTSTTSSTSTSTSTTTSVTTTTSSTSSTSTSTSTTTTTTTTSSTSTTSVTTTTTTTTPACGSGCISTATSTSSRLAFYSFDGNTNDATGVYSAIGIPSPTYTTGYVGSAIYFDATLSQRLSATSMLLNSRSFTIEFWFYLVNGVSNNYAFFGQMSVINTGQQTLFLVATGGRLDIGFFNDDITSSRVLSDYTWYHAAFVYDISVPQQLIYINGLLDTASAVGVGAYLGTSGPITIGGADIYGSLGVPYLTGGMDHLTVSTRAKTACEILNDATLAAYFPFDGSFTDAGPNFLTVTSSGASFSTGFVNQGLSLSGVNSYVQISGLTGLGRSNYAFSIAFWVYPVAAGVLAHISSLGTGLGWCTPFIGISASENIVVQVHNTAGPYPMIGPILPLNSWTHVAHVYSPVHGLQLYINGALAGSNPSALTYTASGAQNFLTIGNVLSGGACYNPGTQITPFHGMIDEFRVYSRDLSASDACNLAWP